MQYYNLSLHFYEIYGPSEVQITCKMPKRIMYTLVTKLDCVCCISGVTFLLNQEHAPGYLKLLSCGSLRT